MVRSGTSRTSSATSVVFPVPDGAETTNRRPRRGSLDILDLLPHLLQFSFDRNDQRRCRRPLGFRSDRVDLAVQLLEQKIELAAAGLGPLGQLAPVLEVRAEPNHLLGDIR